MLDSLVLKKFTNYLELIRFNKPIGFLLLMWPCWFSLSLLDLEKIITESDTVQEATNKVVSVFKKEFTTFEMDIAKDVVTNSWNEYWSDYV